MFCTVLNTVNRSSRGKAGLLFRAKSITQTFISALQRELLSILHLGETPLRHTRLRTTTAINAAEENKSIDPYIQKQNYFIPLL